MSSVPPQTESPAPNAAFDEQAFETLAQMFLTDVDRPAGAERDANGHRRDDDDSEGAASATALASGTTSAREIVLVGHLPVRAGVWMLPYAAARARRADAATALLRCSDDSVRLDLLNSEPDAGWPPIRSALQAVDALRRDVALWIIHSSEHNAAARAVELDADRVTILTSAHDAAVVAAYGLIKSLVDAAAERERPMPTVGLAVLGASAVQADAVVARLNGTTQRFLDTPVELDLCLPRIDADAGCVASWTFHGERCEVRAIVQRIGASSVPRPVDADAGGASRAVRAARSKRPALHATGAPKRRGADSGAADAGEALPPWPIRARAADDADQRVAPDEPSIRWTAGQARPGCAEAAAQRTAGGEAHEPEHARPSVCADRKPADPLHAAGAAQPVGADGVPGLPPHRLGPKPAMSTAVRNNGKGTMPHAAAVGNSMLAGHVDGLTALPVRCPYAPSVQFAVDAHARLHLLRRDDGREDEREPGAERANERGGAVLRDLMRAERWARDHHALLALAFRDRRIDASSRPAWHVFTDDPRRVSDLHDSPVHLHVLAPVEVGGQVAWFAAPLNVPVAV